MNYQDIISNVEIYGLRESMVASGYPMLDEPYTHEEFVTACEDIVVDKNSRHLKRSKNLAGTNIGEGHDNYLNGVIVQFDLKFTVKAWTEAERYHFFDFVSSMSSMHRITKMNFDTVFCSYISCRSEFLIMSSILSKSSSVERLPHILRSFAAPGLPLRYQAACFLASFIPIYSPLSPHSR